MGQAGALPMQRLRKYATRAAAALTVRPLVKENASETKLQELDQHQPLQRVVPECCGTSRLNHPA